MDHDKFRGAGVLPYAYNKKGKVVSKKQHAAGLKAFKNNNLKPLSAEELRNLRKNKL